jgi:hypothetical protein
MTAERWQAGPVKLPRPIEKEASVDILKNNIVVGLGIAVAATALAPILLPVLGGVGRPLVKSLVKGGMALYEKGRESVAMAGESLEDLMAEIRTDEATIAAAPASEPEATHADGAHYRNRGNGSAESTAQSAGTVGV